MPNALDRPRKRQRVTQACERCRSKKYRCDGEHPACKACQVAEVTCSYDTASGRQRGLQPGYIKVLESLWGAVFQTISESEQVASQLLARLPSLAKNTVDESSGTEDSPLTRWRNSAIPDAIRTLLDGGSLLHKDGHPTETTIWSLPQPLSSTGEAGEQDDVQNVSALSPPASTPTALPIEAPDDPRLPELPLDWQVLVQVYLCTEYSCLPIFEKSALYCWAYSYEEQKCTSLRNMKPSVRGQYASLWAALVLGELHLGGVKSARTNHMKQAAKTLLATAESLGPDQTYSHAFLLWSLVYTGCREFTLAKMMLAQAIVLANLRSEGTTANVDPHHALLCGGCFVMETMLAYAIETQATSMAVDADVTHLGDVGEWDPFINALNQRQEAKVSAKPNSIPPSRTGSTFRALIGLMTILRETSQRHINTYALVSDLQSWVSSLTASLRNVIGGHNRSQAIPAALNLQSWYMAVSRAISRTQTGVEVSESLELSWNIRELDVMEGMYITERQYGMAMLPAVSSILLTPVTQHTARDTSRRHAGHVGHNQFITSLSRQWGWQKQCSGEQVGPDVNNLSTMGSDASRVIIDSSQRGPGKAAPTTLVHSEPSECGGSTQPAGVDPVAMVSPPLSAVRELGSACAQPRSQHDNHLPTPAAETALVGCIGPSPGSPISYNLLDYLTMFEANNHDDKGYMEPLGFLDDLDYSI